MADGALDPTIARILAEARLAIDRGEYGQSLRLLEPLAEAHRPVSPIGAGVRLLMATALMGQGETEQAASCCRSLQACIDPTLRSRARELLLVLEAPALRRPRHWSLTLPDLSEARTLESLGGTPRRRRPAGDAEPPPPPVGETRSPLGFAGLVGVVLAGLLLASLLGGCVEIRSELQFEGPGRIQVSHALSSPAGIPTPWMERFQAALGDGPMAFHSRRSGQGWQISSRVLPARTALDALGQSIGTAASLAGVTLPPPVLELQETNWLVGVRQRLSLDLDLGPLDPLPSLALSLEITPPGSAVRLRSAPLTAAVLLRDGRRPARVVWSLLAGERNHLVLTCWRWSPLGLGSLLVVLTLLLTLLLQRIRMTLGFGPPQLPA
jgi:hypothetical protein